MDESLKRLYATGRFASLRAEAEAVRGGVALIFVGRARYFVGIVSVQGLPARMGAHAFVAASGLRLGQPLALEDLQNAVSLVRKSLAQEAYYQARVAYRVNRDASNQEANVTFLVTPGTPAHLSSVQFAGNPVFPTRVLSKKAGWKRGHQLTSARLERGLAKLRQFYQKRHRPQVFINIQQRNYDAKSNTERLSVEVRAGPIVTAHVKGAHVSASRMRALLPVFTEGISDPMALHAGAENLKNYFEGRGHYSAEVKLASVTHPKPDHLDITYQAHLGKSGDFAGFGFEGNRHIPSSELSPVVALRLEGLLFKRSAFNDQQLNTDVDALKSLYRSRGFLEAQITPQRILNYQGERGDLFVKFKIQEGTQTLVSHLEIHGLPPSLEQSVRSLVRNRPGRSFSPDNLLSDREAILSILADRGYAHANMTWEAAPGIEKDSEDVRYDIALGPKESIRQVVILGNLHTREGLIRRDLALEPGQPFDQSKVFDAQQRLYNLGVFNQVQIAEQGPESSESAKRLLVDVEEARRWTLGYGAGVDVQRLGGNQPQGQYKASPRLSLDVTRLNVGGRAQTAALHGQLSTLEKIGQLTYLIPRLPGHPDLSIRFNALAERSSNVLTFTAKREEANLTLSKRFSARTFLSWRFAFRNVQALDISNRISPAEIPILRLPARIGLFAMSYGNDHRDNPIDATRGSYSLADAGIAWTGFGSEANFLRFLAQNSTYYPLTHWLTFARNTRFGVESPYGGLRTIVTKGPKGQNGILRTHDIPLPERFFMGGSESHRGFPINQAGPRDPQTGFPVGGNALFLNSLELRMRFAQNRLGLVLFHDAGNVYSSIRTMRLLKFGQSTPTDFDYTSQAVGLGVLYNTPVGPLRFDMGYNLNPPRFQVRSGSTVEVRRLSAFQFFISVGQSF